MQVNLNPAGCAGHILAVVLSSPPLEQKEKTWFRVKMETCFFLSFIFDIHSLHTLHPDLPQVIRTINEDNKKALYFSCQVIPDNEKNVSSLRVNVMICNENESLFTNCEKFTFHTANDIFRYIF